MGWLLLLCLVLSAIGFKKYVYFFSIGYGWAIAGEGIALLIYYYGRWYPAVVCLCLLLIAYGVRLSGYLILREYKSALYRKTFKEMRKEGSSMSLIAKLAIWISVSILYVLLIAGIYYRLANAIQESTVAWVGVIIMGIAWVIEALADYQKSKYKKQRPDMVAMNGLYRFVRCPNYFAELLFWAGAFISGITCYQNLLQWSAGIAGYICIVIVMLNGTYRLEKRQIQTYQGKKEYDEYVKKTPIVLPFIPWYHIVQQKK